MVRGDLQHLQLTAMTAFGQALRATSRGARSMEECGQRIVELLHQGLVREETREPACALVRFYRTLRFAELDDDLKQFAAGGAPDRAGLAGDVRCLTLLGTAGDEPAWNSRHASRGHRTIPLPSEQAVTRIPMVAQLLTQLGVGVKNVVSGDPRLLLDMEQQTYSVFYVAEAEGSPFIPAQHDFVKPFGIRSVVGFGGILPSADVFAVLCFSKVPVSRPVADLFRNAALNVKVALLPFVEGPTFTPR